MVVGAGCKLLDKDGGATPAKRLAEHPFLTSTLLQVHRKIQSLRNWSLLGFSIEIYRFAELMDTAPGVRFNRDAWFGYWCEPLGAPTLLRYSKPPTFWVERPPPLFVGGSIPPYRNTARQVLIAMRYSDRTIRNDACWVVSPTSPPLQLLS